MKKYSIIILAILSISVSYCQENSVITTGRRKVIEMQKRDFVDLSVGKKISVEILIEVTKEELNLGKFNLYKHEEKTAVVGQFGTNVFYYVENNKEYKIIRWSKWKKRLIKYFPEIKNTVKFLKKYEYKDIPEIIAKHNKIIINNK